MKSNLLSDVIMTLLHTQGLDLAYECAVAEDYIHTLQCDCSGGCRSDCSGGCAMAG